MLRAASAGWLGTAPTAPSRRSVLGPITRRGPCRRDLGTLARRLVYEYPPLRLTRRRACHWRLCTQTLPRPQGLQWVAGWHATRRGRRCVRRTFDPTAGRRPAQWEPLARSEALARPLAKRTPSGRGCAVLGAGQVLATFGGYAGTAWHPRAKARGCHTEGRKAGQGRAAASRPAARRGPKQTSCGSAWQFSGRSAVSANACPGYRLLTLARKPKVS